MARNVKATRSARALFALGALAKGIDKGLDRRDALALKLAEREIEKRKQEQTDKEQRDTLRLNVIKSMQSQEFPDPSDPTGARKITIRGVPQETVEQQFPDLLLAPPKVPLPAIPDVDPGAKGRPVAPPQPGGIQAAPGSHLETLRYTQSLLDKIPTDLSTAATAGASKALGGERGGIGSNAIKEYEDAKPAAAVQFYRAITGDTRLSDNDARERALPFMPTVWPIPDTAEVRKGKMARLAAAVQLAEKQRAANPNLVLDISAVMSQANNAAQAGQLQLGPPAPPPIANPDAVKREIERGDRIKVRQKGTNKTGSILRKDFDPAKYEAIQ